MRDERGSATVLGLALIFVCLLVGVLAVSLGELAGARARLSAAADLAALAGAAHGLRGDQCAAAARVATLGGAELVTCELSGEDVAVAVSGEVPGIIAKIMGAAGEDPPRIEVRARAGPRV